MVCFLISVNIPTPIGTQHGHSYPKPTGQTMNALTAFISKTTAFIIKTDPMAIPSANLVITSTKYHHPL